MPSIAQVLANCIPSFSFGACGKLYFRRTPITRHGFGACGSNLHGRNTPGAIPDLGENCPSTILSRALQRRKSWRGPSSQIRLAYSTSSRLSAHDWLLAGLARRAEFPFSHAAFLQQQKRA